MSTDDVGLKCTADNVLSSLKNYDEKKEKDKWIKKNNKNTPLFCNLFYNHFIQYLIF